jgi:acyl carrier protein
VTLAQAPRDFLDFLLPHLPELTDEPFDGDTPLGSLGLDSMGMISLMVDLETKFDFTFPEEEVTAEAFFSANSLWSIVSRLADLT